MIIYNVTVTLEPEIQEDWIQWMLEKHIPDVMNTGLFKDYRICRLLGYDQITYTIQYVCKDMETYETYQADFAPALQADHKARYGDKALGFRSLMEQIT